MQREPLRHAVRDPPAQFKGIDPLFQYILDQIAFDFAEGPPSASQHHVIAVRLQLLARRQLVLVTVPPYTALVPAGRTACRQHKCTRVGGYEITCLGCYFRPLLGSGTSNRSYNCWHSTIRASEPDMPSEGRRTRGVLKPADVSSSCMVLFVTTSTAPFVFVTWQQHSIRQ
eukprot:1777301-Rhodomonas_salina.8